MRQGHGMQNPCKVLLNACFIPCDDTTVKGYQRLIVLLELCTKALDGSVVLLLLSRDLA